MINPWAIIIVGAVWAVSLGGAYVKGQTTGADRVLAKQAGEDQVRRETREAAQQGAAEAIAKIEVKNVTIQGRVQTIVRENTVYRDCRHAPGGVLDINEALTGRRPEPAGDGKLPGTGAPR